MNPLVVAGLTFATVAGIIVAMWWVLSSEYALRARLASPGAAPRAASPTVLRTATPAPQPLVTQIAAALPLARRLDRLAEQAGWPGGARKALRMMILLACVGAAIGAARTGEPLLALASASLGAALPVAYLAYRRNKRLEKFEEQFPEALDMVTRSLRAGYALGAAIQLIGDEMPDPVGPEFRRVFEEISLGRPPTEALRDLYDRIAIEDLRFFYTAVSIQRDVGGNLAEILDKLSEVIRERFRLLSYARVLSAQHRASAYCVAASPFAMAIIFATLNPGYFDALLRWPNAKLLIAAALVMQVIGFFMLKRIATITV